MSTTLQISGDLIVNDVIRHWPSTVTVFARYGIDSCCGGGLALEVVCERHRIDLAALLEDLNQAVRA